MSGRKNCYLFLRQLIIRKMSSFIQTPVKKTQAVDFVKPLSNYIKNTFSGEVLNENKDTLVELNQLRGNAVVRSLDKHESSLDVIQRC